MSLTITLSGYPKDVEFDHDGCVDNVAYESADVARAVVDSTDNLELAAFLDDVLGRLDVADCQETVAELRRLAIRRGRAL